MSNRVRGRCIAMMIAVVVNTILVGLRFYVYRLTGSTAVLADALESVVNIFASGFAFYAVWLAAKPPDRSHPYGYGEIEFFSAGFEGALIILAAILILYEAFREHPVGRELSGVLPLTVVGFGTLGLGIGLLKAGKRLNSMAVRADGKHAFVDAVTSIGVVVALLAVKWTGQALIDTGCAVGLALYIAWEGGELLRNAGAKLMQEYEPGLMQRISDAIGDPWGNSVRHLRAWVSGERVHVDFVFQLDGRLPLKHAHGMAFMVERRIRKELPDVRDILIHVEPEGNRWDS